MLLAIDTSSGTSVAVVDRDGGILSEMSEPDTRRHAEIIGTLIQQCLRDSGVATADLSGVAVGMGPGPFTGLRVGIAAARAFAFGAGKPVVPVVSHDAIALEQLALVSASAASTNDPASHGDLLVQPSLVEPVLVVTDARRREVYWSAYSGADAQGLPIRVEGPGLLRPEDLETSIPQFNGYRRFDAATVSAGAIGLLAERLFQFKRPFAGNDALYLRSPDVTMSTGPKRVS